MSGLFTFSHAIALLTLTILEIVLGVDNVIFIAIISQALPREQQGRARTIGLALALVGRIAMVLGISWMLGLKAELFAVAGHGFSIKDIVLLSGGVFLVYKAVTEVYRTTELKEEDETVPVASKMGMAATIAQIAVIDMVFAIDSVLTAVGLTNQVVLIIIAMTIAIVVMMLYAGKLADFIHEHPSIKVLALAFLVLVGVLLISDSFGREVDRTYVYFAILFSLAVEGLNFRRTRNERRKRDAKRAEVARED